MLTKKEIKARYRNKVRKQRKRFGVCRDCDSDAQVDFVTTPDGQLRGIVRRGQCKKHLDQGAAQQRARRARLAGIGDREPCAGPDQYRERTTPREKGVERAQP